MAAVFTGFLSIFKIYGFLDESETHSVMGSLPTDHAQLFFPFKKRKDSILELRTIFCSNEHWTVFRYIYRSLTTDGVSEGRDSRDCESQPNQRNKENLRRTDKNQQKTKEKRHDQLMARRAICCRIVSERVIKRKKRRRRRRRRRRMIKKKERERERLRGRKKGPDGFII